MINAGHPPPVLIAADGQIELLEHPSTLILGVGGGTRAVRSAEFRPGDRLLLYTDGLVERRGEDADTAMARLITALKTARTDAPRQAGSPRSSRSCATPPATTTSPPCSSPATRSLPDPTPQGQDVRVGGSHRADSKQEPGHGHGHGAEVELEVAPLPRAVLLAVLAAVAVAVVAGVVLLWPDSGKVDDLKGSVGFAVEGATFPKATVDEVLPACPRAGPDEEPDTSEPCGQVKVTVDEGVDKGTEATVDVPPEVSDSGLAKGDQLVLLRTPAQDGQPAILVLLRDRAVHLALARVRAVRGGRPRRGQAPRPDGTGRARGRRCGVRWLRDPGPARRPARGAWSRSSRRR